MRMSSGPSARKENPRWGSSSCGEETPRSKSTPSIVATLASSRTCGSSENQARRKTNRGSRLGFRSGIAVDADESARGAQRIEHAAAVSAATESGIDVAAFGLDRQRGHGFLEQDRAMRCIGDQSEKPSSLGGSPPAGNVA